MPQLVISSSTISALASGRFASFAGNLTRIAMTEAAIGVEIGGVGTGRRTGARRRVHSGTPFCAERLQWKCLDRAGCFYYGVRTILNIAIIAFTAVRTG